MLCVTKTIVLRVSAAIRISSRCMPSRVWASSAPNGSSISTTSGSVASVRAMATRWRIPPDQPVGLRRLEPLQPDHADQCVDPRVAPVAFVPRPAQAQAEGDVSRTVSQGNSAKSWNTIPRDGEGPLIGSPCIRRSPLDGARCPAMM